jgi:hypothetical protein
VRAPTGGRRAPLRWPVLNVPTLQLPGLGAGPDAARPIWLDSIALGLAVFALLLDGVLALLLWRQFDSFPDLIALHFNAYGEADLIGGKNEIFKLPIIGAVIWASNAVLAWAAWRFDPVLARLLLGVSLLVQVIFAVAAWRILA